MKKIDICYKVENKSIQIRIAGSGQGTGNPQIYPWGVSTVESVKQRV